MSRPYLMLNRWRHRATVFLSVATALMLMSLPASAQSVLDVLSDLDPALQQGLTDRLGAQTSSSADLSGTAGMAVSNPAGGPSLQYLAVLEREQLLERRAQQVYRPNDTILIEVGFVEDGMTSSRTPASSGSLAMVPVEADSGIAAPSAQPARSVPTLSTAERAELQRLIDLIRSRNPYRLDSDGALTLPGYAPIVLAGLNDQQASLRLSSEAGLRKLSVQAVKLPVKQVKPFGYDIFGAQPSGVAPTTSPFRSALANAPTPTSYTLGVGDEVLIQLYGGQNRNLRLTVSRDGVINFPELGPIPVAGKSLGAIVQDIETRVENQLIGTKVSVSLGNTQGVQVFVLGDAERPGSYNVGANATVTTALFAAGGIKESGSLRNIEIKRGGDIVRRVDLYALLLQGDTSGDMRLRDGDVVFIPPVGATVTVEGEVRRSAIYEIDSSASVADVVTLAGGVTPNADRSRLVLSQMDPAQRRAVKDVSLMADAARTQSVRDGDVLRVLPLRPVVDLAVGIEGHVHRQSLIAWREGLRLADALPSLDDLKPNADAHYVLVRREQVAERRISVVSTSLVEALRAPDSMANITLQPRDRIIVLDAEGGRRQLLEPLLTELRAQSTLEQPTEVVTVSGQVRAPGEYPLETGMRVSDLLRAGGRLLDSAYGASAELARRRYSGNRWETELLSIDLAAVQRGDMTLDFALRPGDTLVVQQAPEWLQDESVTLLGEVRFPGTYPIRRGETLRSVLERAGGLTSLANPQGSVFTREELRQLERREIERLTERLRKDLAASALLNAQSVSGDAANVLPLVQNLLEQINEIEPVGRLVIDLNTVIASRLGSTGDIVLRGGDQLIVPKFRQEVSVIGEVQNVSAHLHRAGFDLNDYIALSGGTSSKADKRRIFVVRADGSVAPPSRLSFASWLNFGSADAIRPGDTIVVPLDTESLPRLAQLQLWQSVTTILYNSAVAVAAIRGL